MAYSKKLVDHYENPRNVGSLDKESKEVGTGLVGAPACGDVSQWRTQRVRCLAQNLLHQLELIQCLHLLR